MSSIRTTPNLNERDILTGDINGSIVGGQGNTNQINIYSHGFGPVFDRLCRHVASNASFNSAEVAAQPKCHEGTRIAILDHLTSWAAASSYHYSITWLYGPAGSGKSTILCTIAQRLFDRNLLLSSFFFIPTMAYQLALSIPATRPFIMKAIEMDLLIFSTSLWEQARALVIAPIIAVHQQSPLDTGQYRRIFVIDGLDECRDSDTQCETLQVLNSILRHFIIPLAILVASRPEQHFRLAFNLGDLNAASTRLHFDNSYKADQDIKKYFMDEFGFIREKHLFRSHLPTYWPPSGTIETLVRKSSEQFIYASTVVRFIKSARHNPEKRLEILMRASDAGKAKAFEELDPLYATIFNTIDLAWDITCSRSSPVVSSEPIKDTMRDRAITQPTGRGRAASTF
ncbi:hypothetical protein CPB84DRAFT_1841105 [Gymnopilus junonius]|uniref:NACHT domain-containing protein n=1 Tax=Gymnopilus junonius TaxID=109634 RepID=A0A9P5P401_GYMJU|nr:hypothetical protein CPB84DRAFT_1841105 [Gymnopilus junonius]